MDAGTGEPSVRLLGLILMAPVAGYVLITPGPTTSNGAGQILRAIATVLVSAAILIVTTGSDWHVSHAVIRTQYSAFSNRKVEGALAIRIGLDSATVQLQGTVPELPLNSVNYNEKFIWSHAGDMKRHYKDALLRGLPYPILTAAEYLSLDNDGFRWGRHYRQAGYYTYFCLWSAYALWLLSNILWPVDPSSSAMTLTTTGIALLLTNAVYTINLSKRALVIPYDGLTLEFTYGWCYYLTAAIGIVCISLGCSVSISRFLKASDQFHAFHISAEKLSMSLEDPSANTWKKCFNKYSRLDDSKNADICWAR